MATPSKGLCTEILLIAVLKSIICISDFIVVNTGRLSINWSNTCTFVTCYMCVVNMTPRHISFAECYASSSFMHTDLSLYPCHIPHGFGHYISTVF